MKKIVALCLLIVAAIEANYSVVNNSGHYVLFSQVAKEHEDIASSAGPTQALFLIKPGCSVRVDPAYLYTDFAKGSEVSASYFSKINKEVFEKNAGKIRRLPNDVGTVNWKKSDSFITPDDAYGAILTGAKGYLPEIIITHDAKTDKPVINAPATTKELENQIAQKKLAATKNIHEATGLPQATGGISGLITEFAGEEE